MNYLKTIISVIDINKNQILNFLQDCCLFFRKINLGGVLCEIHCNQPNDVPNIRFAKISESRAAIQKLPH